MSSGECEIWGQCWWTGVVSAINALWLYNGTY